MREYFRVVSRCFTLRADGTQVELEPGDLVARLEHGVFASKDGVRAVRLELPPRLDHLEAVAPFILEYVPHTRGYRQPARCTEKTDPCTSRASNIS